jgi:hypothetical protein
MFARSVGLFFTMFVVALGTSGCGSGATTDSDLASVGGTFASGATGGVGAMSASGTGGTSAGAGGFGGMNVIGGASGMGSGGAAGVGATAGAGGAAGTGAAGTGESGEGGAAGMNVLAGAGGTGAGGAGGTGVGGMGAAGMGTGGMETGGVGAGGTGVGGIGGAAGMAGAAGMDEPDPPASEFPASRDFTRAGTFTTTSEAGGFSCTIYRPRTLGEEGRKHPVIVWGNGTLNTPSSYDALFHHFASHGFIVSAANTSSSGSGVEMVACLDYILMENGSAGTFQDKIDVNRIAASGYSQGGAGTLMAGRDPRFVTTAAVAPYVVLPLGGFLWSSVRAQIHPMFMLSGGSDLVAVPADNQTPIFETAPVPIVWAARSGAGHLEVLGNGGNFRGPLTAWFRYRLMGDDTAAAWFEKGTCELCSAFRWNVEHNALWTE